MLLVSAASSNSVDLGTIIVNSDQTEYQQTGQVYSANEPSFSSKVNQRSFKGKFQDLPDVIESQTSVQIRQSGGLGSFSSASLRGASSSQVMVFLDGIPLNDSSTGAGVDLSSIPLSDVDTIEIYRGNTPINFGTASIGGAINIKTKHNKDDKLHSSANIGTGSFGTWKFGASVSQKISKFSYLINGDLTSSKNNFTFINNNGTKWNENDDKKEKRNNNQFKQGSNLVELTYSFNDDTKLMFSNQYFQKNQHLPNWNNNPGVKTTFDTIRNMSNIKLIADTPFGYLVNSATRLDYSYKREIYDDTQGAIGLGVQHNKYRTNTYGFNQFFEWPLYLNTLSTVFDIRHEEYKTKDLLLVQTDDPSSRNSYSVSIEDKLTLLSSSLILAPAISVESYSNNYQNSKQSSTYLNPKLGIKYQVIQQIAFKSNLARYVREPSFFELFGDRGLLNGNPDLKAEKGINFDFGGELKIQKTLISVAYFVSKVNDIISYVYNSQGIGKAMNNSQALIEGIESSLDSEFLKYFRVVANYTWQIPKNKDTITAFNGKYLPGRFRHTFFSKIEAKKSFVSSYYEFLYSSGLYYDGANLLKAPIKREHNVGMTFSLGPFALTAEVKNIGNKNYEDFNGYPQPGRSYWLTLRYELN